MVDFLSPPQPGQLYQIAGLPGYISSQPGSGGGLVTSVFGRIGAVVAANGDYDSGQVTNASAVAGPTVSAALNTLSGQIAGLTSNAIANASGVAGATVTAALNTLAAAVVLAGALVSNTAQGQAPQTNGTAGQALIATATGSTWSNNFQARDLVTTGSLSVGGANPASTGGIRLPNNIGIKSRNVANTVDAQLFAFSNGDSLGIGDTNFPTVITGASGPNSVRIQAGAVDALRVGTSIGFLVTSVSWNSSQTTPSLFQDNQTGNGINGQPLLVRAQNSTGTVTTGGSLTLSSGSGTATNGTLNLQVASTNVAVFDAGRTQVDFQALNLITTGDIAVGTTPAGTGDIRTPATFAWSRRNAANSADINVVSGGASDSAVFGDTTSASANMITATTSGNLRTGSTNRVTWTASTLSLATGVNTFDFGSGSDSQIRIDGVDAIGFDRGAATTRNLAFWGPGTTAFQAGDKITFWGDRVAAPTGNPAAGFFAWSETGGLPAWRNVAGDVMIWTLTTAATATAGGGAALPATIAEYITINYKGNVRKIPTYAN